MHHYQCQCKPNVPPPASRSENEELTPDILQSTAADIILHHTSAVTAVSCQFQAHSKTRYRYLDAANV